MPLEGINLGERANEGPLGSGGRKGKPLCLGAQVLMVVMRVEVLEYAVSLTSLLAFPRLQRTALSPVPM